MPYAKSIRWAAITFPEGARPWASFGVPGVVDFVGGILGENQLFHKMFRNFNTKIGAVKLCVTRLENAPDGGAQ